MWYTYFTAGETNSRLRGEKLQYALLPPEVTSTRSTSSSLSTFKSKLKTYLFFLSFPDLVTVKSLKCILHYST